MRREILFRGKKQSTGEWVYGSLITNEKPGLHTIAQVNTNPVQNGVLTGWCFGVLPETVGQFTGLTDKNGKRIFEGDVVKRTVNMRYYADCDGIETKIHNIEYFGIELLPFSECGFYMEEYEIIGNQHDNPELI